MLLLLSALSLAHAEGSEGFGIWNVDPTYTTGNLEFFLEVFVDAEQFPSQVEPKQADEAGGTGDLHIQNKSTTFEFISINGVKVGRLGPLTTAEVHNLPAGSYDVTIEYPHGFSYTKQMHTTGGTFDPETEVLVPSDEVVPVPMPTVDEVPEAIRDKVEGDPVDSDAPKKE
ncbi:MAG TPA: hypothetical protein QGF58_10795 [Myxococcota bacterium]|nr:hypothetical protein [Myxococcota bacterium]